jgi:hypothetical protein
MDIKHVTDITEHAWSCHVGLYTISEIKYECGKTPGAKKNKQTCKVQEYVQKTKQTSLKSKIRTLYGSQNTF